MCTPYWTVEKIHRGSDDGYEMGNDSLKMLPLTMLPLLAAVPSTALLTEIVRVSFFPKAQWREQFHFLLVLLCWVKVFLIQFTLVSIAKPHLFHKRRVLRLGIY